MMKRRSVEFVWEDPDAQKVFAEWKAFPSAEATAAEVDRLEALLGLTPGLDVLDVGCGNGRHAIEMARRGYRVLGIDVAATYLDEAVREATKEGAERVEFRNARASALTECEAYDLALALGHTIGLMPEEEVPEHFSRICQTLKPGGRFLMTLAGPRTWPGHAPEPVKNWAENDGKFIMSDKVWESGHRVEYCVVVDTNAGEIVEYYERQRLVSLEQVCALLTNAGFESVEAFDDLGKHPATPEDFRVFLCQRAS